MIRRVITLVLMGFAFYGGLQAERLLAEGRCQNAGGVYGEDHICRGAP